MASGIPLGGLGTGSFEIRPDGRFHDWEIFNNHQWSGGYEDVPPDVWSEDCFFALRTKEKGEEPRVRLLYDDDKKARAIQFRHEYTPIYVLPFMRNIQEIEYTGTHPFAQLKYRDSRIPVKAELEAFTPFIPFDEKNSGLPLAYFTFNVKNRGRKPVETSLLFAMRNFSGYDTRTQDFVHTLRRGKKSVSIDMTAENLPEKHRTAGSMTLTAFNPDATWMTGWGDGHGMAGFDNADTPAFHQAFLSFRDTGDLPGGPKVWNRRVTRKEEEECCGLWNPERSERHWRSALCSKIKLKPGQEKRIVFMLSWFYPNHFHYRVPEIRLGHMYENWFKDSKTVSVYGEKNYSQLKRKSRAFCDNLYKGLEPWFADSLNAQLTTFPQAFWWTKGGDMGCWEGMACCQMMPGCTTHWSAFQPLLFFPDMYIRMKKRLLAFKREDAERKDKDFLEADFLSRQVKGEKQNKQHTFGGWWEKRWKREGYTLEEILNRGWGTASDHPYFGREGGAIGFVRDYQWTGDRSLLEENWEELKAGLISRMDADTNGDGLPDGSVSYLTYDHWFIPGLNCYRSTMWLAELRAAQYIARLMKDDDAERKITEVLTKGIESFEKVFWNGEYFNLARDFKKNIDDKGCLADQVSGHLYLRLCGLEPNHKLSKVKKALKSVHRYNRPAEQGLINGADPQGRDDWTYFARFSERGDDEQFGGQWPTPWTGTEYYVAAVMIAEGLVKEGLDVARDVYERHVDFGMLYNHIECGEHYFRAMAAWAMLPAIQGLVFNADEMSLAFAPKTGKKNCDMPFILPGAWGRLFQKKEKGKIKSEIMVAEGVLKLKQILLESRNKIRSVHVRISRKDVPAEYTQQGSRVSIRLKQTAVLKKGTALSIVMN